MVICPRASFYRETMGREIGKSEPPKHKAIDTHTVVPCLSGAAAWRHSSFSVRPPWKHQSAPMWKRPPWWYQAAFVRRLAILHGARRVGTGGRILARIT
jgi:hypothetical protein